MVILNFTEYTWGDESQNVLPDVLPANKPADLSQQGNCSNSSNVSQIDCSGGGLQL